MVSVLIFAPLLAALVIALYEEEDAAFAKRLALGVSAALTLLALGLYLRYPGEGFAYLERAAWMPFIGASYHVGLDGLSLPFVVLTPLLGVVSVLASWRKKDRAFFALLLVLEGALVGVFAALDLLLFFVFFEVVLVPMFFIIAVWGYEARRYAAMKFLLYSLVGSVFLLAAILGTAYFAGEALGRPSFDFFELGKVASHLAAHPAAPWLFLGFLVAFLIKLPSVPLHTWLPHAHTQAPTAGSIFLAGVLLKMGGYGLIRFGMGIFPLELARFAPLLAALGAISVLWGGYVTLAQTDLKRLIANSSVNHMGYVLLGVASLTAVGLHGAVYQMVAHGVITALMFLMVGLLAERTHTREIAAMRGVYASAPLLGGIFWLALLGGLGLPGLAGFLGEFQALWGAYLGEATRGLVWVALAGLLVLVGAMLWTIQRVLLGEREREIADLDPIELAAAAPLVVLAVLLGLVPALLTPWIDSGVQPLLAFLRGLL